MNRKEKIDFVLKNIINAPEANIPHWFDHADVLKECVRALDKYRIGKPADIPMIAEVRNGYVFINGEPLLRVGTLNSDGYEKFDDERASYYEGMILARQEMIDL